MRLIFTLFFILATGNAFGAAITAYPQLSTPSENGYTIWYDPAQPMGQRDRTVTLNTIRGSILGASSEVNSDITIPVTAGMVMVSTLSTDEIRTITMPSFSSVPVDKRISVIHTTGSSGLVTIPTTDGLEQIDLAPGQGVTMIKRVAGWQIIGRL